MEPGTYSTKLTEEVVMAFANAHCTYPRKDIQAELAWVADCIARWFTRRRRLPIPVLTQPDRQQ